MVQTIKYSVFFGIMVGILCMGCRQGLIEPKEEKVRFKFTFCYGKTHGPKLISKQSQDKDEGGKISMGKDLNIQDFNLARVMVLDWSAYDSLEILLRSQDWNDFLDVRNDWTGNRDSWAEWKGFLGDFFPIVVDQTLNIEGYEATGTVSGVIGLNRIIVALTEGDIIRYKGEATPYVTEGKTEEVEMWVEPWGNW